MKNIFEHYLKEAMAWDNGADREYTDKDGKDTVIRKTESRRKLEELLNEKYKNELLSLSEELKKHSENLNIEKILSFGPDDDAEQEEIEDYLEDIFGPIRSSIRELKAFK